MRDSWDKTDVEMVDNNSESEQGSSRGSWHRDRLNNACNVSIFLEAAGIETVSTMLTMFVSFFMRKHLCRVKFFLFLPLEISNYFLEIFNHFITAE